MFCASRKILKGWDGIWKSTHWGVHFFRGITDAVHCTKRVYIFVHIKFNFTLFIQLCVWWVPLHNIRGVEVTRAHTQTLYSHKILLRQNQNMHSKAHTQTYKNTGTAGKMTFKLKFGVGGCVCVCVQYVFDKVLIALWGNSAPDASLSSAYFSY